LAFAIGGNDTIGSNSVNSSDVLETLKGVNDPELGMNIVDLGLVYRAELGPDGIEVALTLSTPSCPLGEMIVEVQSVTTSRNAACDALRNFT